MTAAQLSPEQAKLIGDLLKNTREQQGKNINDVAYQIALSPAQLRAIEAADLRPFYSHSFFYQAAERYAKFLNISLPAQQTENNQNLFARDIPSTAPIVVTQPVTTDRDRQQSVEVRDNHPVDGETPQPQKTFQPQPQIAAQSTAVHASKATPSRKLPAFVLVAIIAAVGITLGLERESAPPATADTTEPAANNTATAPTTTQASAPSAPTTAPTTTPTAAPQVQSASGAAASAAGSLSATAAVAPRPTDTADKPDSSLESTTTAWVQIVRKNGDKSNLKVEPGQKIEFVSASTAAIVFGQPEKAKLVVKGKAVDTNRFVTPDNPGRALVILNQIP